MSEDQFEQAHRDIDRDIAGAKERAAAAAGYRRKVDELRGRASVDGVTAEVDVSGALVALDLPHDLRYKTGAKLSATILQTIRTAYADVVTKVRAEAGSTFGADSPVTQRMDDELAKRVAVIGEPEVMDRSRPRW